MRRSTISKWAALALLTVIAGIMIYIALTYQNQELVWAYTCEISEGSIVNSDCIEKVTVSKNREYDAVLSGQSITGMWAARDLHNETLAVPGDITMDDPGVFRFPATGIPLEEGNRVFYLEVPPQVLTLAKPNTLISMWLYQPDDQGTLRGDSMYVILDKVEVMQKYETGIYVQFTPDQIAQIYRLREAISNQPIVDQMEMSQMQGGVMPTEEEIENILAGERALVWSITQPNNETLDPLYFFSTKIDPNLLWVPEESEDAGDMGEVESPGGEVFESEDTTE